MRTSAGLSLGLLALLTFAAGCSESGDDDQPDPTATASETQAEEHGLEADTYALHVAGLPDAVAPGETYNFTLHVQGTLGHPSDHVGAHWGPVHVEDGTSSADMLQRYDQACIHQAGTLPGEFIVECIAPGQPGTYYLRGHARITEGADAHHWWSAEHEIHVAV